jgi:hypothetical protein
VERGVGQDWDGTGREKGGHKGMRWMSSVESVRDGGLVQSARNRRRL